MRETGTVIRLCGGRAAIRIESPAPEVCRSCRACQAIGPDRSGFVLWVDADDLAAHPVQEGDQVTIDVALPSPWRAILLVFVVPLAALLTGLVLGSQWTALQRWTGLGPQGAGLVGGGVLIALAFVVVWMGERRFEKRHRPRVVEVKRPA